MKESITNVLALFGAITVLISIGFLIFMTVVTWKEHTKEEKRRRKEHMKLHIDLKGSLLRNAIASTVDIVKE